MKKIYALMIALFMVNGAMAQWFPQNQSMFDTLFYLASSVYFTDVNRGYVLTYPLASKGYDVIVDDGIGSILKTTDGGANWFDPNPGGEVVWGNSVFFVNADTGFVAGYYSRKTTDGGLSWTGLNAGAPCGLNSFFFTGADTGYVVGGSIHYSFPPFSEYWTFIAKTIDGGSTWSTLKNEEDSVPLNSVFFTNSNTGYTVGASGTILKTTDGGSNWIKQSSQTSTSLSSVYFPATDTGYVVGGSGTILKTTDGGLNWIALLSGTNIGLASVFFTDINTGYTVGGNLILKTIDGGLNWFEQSVVGLGDYYHFNSVFFPAADTGYIAGDNLDQSCILKTENGGGFPVGLNNQTKNTLNLSISPNPASTSITLTPPVKGILYIYNTSGQQILQQQITEPITTIDVSLLRCGVYVVKVVGEKGVCVGKFIKQ